MIVWNSVADSVCSSYYWHWCVSSSYYWHWYSRDSTKSFCICSVLSSCHSLCWTLNRVIHFVKLVPVIQCKKKFYSNVRWSHVSSFCSSPPVSSTMLRCLHLQCSLLFSFFLICKESTNEWNEQIDHKMKRLRPIPCSFSLWWYICLPINWWTSTCEGLELWNFKLFFLSCL
jgi:hypothetical protein